MSAAETPLRVALLSPYHSGSHRAWAVGYSRSSEHAIALATLPGRFWKWRMHGGAVTLARQYLESAELRSTHIIIADDMLDVTTFQALTKSCTADTPVVLYMHENQLTYPLPTDGNTGPMRRQHGERDLHYVFINYASMLAADAVWFNSRYHRDSWFDALPRYLRRFPDFNEHDTITALYDKATVMPVGVDLSRLDVAETGADSAEPLILWNQRWEYDKNPAAFFALLYRLQEDGIPFQVALCGERFSRSPDAFDAAIARLGPRIIHAGFADDNTYRQLLWRSDLVVSTAIHEFFGISVLEALHCRTFPLLPHRLSYPELLPDAWHVACLYHNDADLYEKAVAALTNLSATRAAARRLATSASRFDWRRIAPAYDCALSRLSTLLD